MEYSTLFNEGNVFEMSGNIALGRDFENMKWKSPAYGPAAYVGKIVTEKDGFFHGYFMNLVVSGIGEYPVVGRFVKGRNENVHVLFYVIKTLGCECWMKRKLSKRNYGVRAVNDCCSKERKKYHIDGFFSFDLEEHYIKDAKDKEALTSIITAEYERLLRIDKSFKNEANDFTGKFDSVMDSMLDLIDELEEKEIKIVFP